MDIKFRKDIISAIAVIISAIIVGLFGLFQGWYTVKSPPKEPSQKTTTTVAKMPKEENEKIINKNKDVYNKAKKQIGDKVLSMWKAQGILYPGTVREIKEGKYLIAYDFSGEEEEWVEKKNIYLPIPPKESELGLNTKVFVQQDKSGQIKWIPAIIKDIRNGKYYVKYNDGHEWVGIERFILQ